MTYKEFQHTISEAENAIAEAKAERLRVLVPYKENDEIEIEITKTIRDRWNGVLLKGTVLTGTFWAAYLTSAGKNAYVHFNFDNNNGNRGTHKLLTDKFKWV